MKIEEYFSKIQSDVDSSPLVLLKNVAYEKRGTHEGFIRGELHFQDDTVLHFREYVDVEMKADA